MARKEANPQGILEKAIQGRYTEALPLHPTVGSAIIRTENAVDRELSNCLQMLIKPQDKNKVARSLVNPIVEHGHSAVEMPPYAIRIGETTILPHGPIDKMLDVINKAMGQPTAKIYHNVIMVGEATEELVNSTWIPHTAATLLALQEFPSLGYQYIDLGAGAGISGMQALMKGAGRVDLIENFGPQIEHLEQNLKMNGWSGDKIRIVNGDFGTMSAESLADEDTPNVAAIANIGPHEIFGGKRLDSGLMAGLGFIRRSPKISRVYLAGFGDGKLSPNDSILRLNSMGFREIGRVEVPYQTKTASGNAVSVVLQRDVS